MCCARLTSNPLLSWLSDHDPFQFVVFGLEGAGKTTLLYKLRLESWKKENLIPDLEQLKKRDPENHGLPKDPTYHYEELSSNIVGRYGVWEVPGSEVMMRMWPMFYRYLRITAIIFVVDGFSIQPDNMDDIDLDKIDFDKIALARQKIEFLMNEDELRGAAFILILNVKGTDTEEDKSEFAHAIFDMLGAREFEKLGEQKPHMQRFKKYAVNCSDIRSDDEEWEKILKEIKTIYNRVGEGSLYWL
mmetsp:Transcript_55710/g.156893  ORF Transcript_55710/g.156893 Transcript_55710/m.156893 type:complete len:245 (-) Transcript_55710:154-888(-)